MRTAGGGRELAEVSLQPEPTATVHQTSDAEIDDEVESAYQAHRDGTPVDRQIATLERPLVRTDAERFDGESRAGNFLADAIRQTVCSDFALFPAGSLRDGPPLTGPVTVGDVVSLAPFEDPVREVSLTGTELRRALDGAAAPHSSDRGWVHAHVSGGQVHWAGDGSLNRVTVDEAAVSDDQQYSVATTGWLVEVDDTFDPIVPAEEIDEHAPIYQAAIEHARNGGFRDIDQTGRIQKD